MIGRVRCLTQNNIYWCLHLTCIGKNRYFYQFLSLKLIFIFDLEYLFLYFINLQNERLKPVLEYKIVFWICVLVLWIHKGYCEVKKLVYQVFVHFSSLIHLRRGKGGGHEKALLTKLGREDGFMPYECQGKQRIGFFLHQTK